MITNSDFNFKKNEIVTLELPFSEHIEELRQRIFHIFWIILLLTLATFFDVKFIGTKAPPSQRKANRGWSFATFPWIQDFLIVSSHALRLQGSS